MTGLDWGKDDKKWLDFEYIVEIELTGNGM